MYILLLLAGAFVVPLRAEESNSDQLKELLGLIQNAGPEQNILENINLPENVFLNISQYLEKYGYPLETHQVETEDGFTLILHRIPASKSISKNNPAVLFAPPLMSSSIDWVNHGSNYSLGLLLSDLDYDIWLLNPRGTRYSMTHNTLNSTQKKFWSYSFHEKGYYDTAVSIDYVLNLTGQQKVTVVGYSEGTSALLALAAARPEYNEKINLIVLLSPIGYMGGVTSPIALFQVKYMTEIKALLEAVNFHAIPYAKWVSELLVAICSIDGSGETCAAALGPLVGYDTEEVDLDYLLIFISDKPSGLALQELYHYGQEILSDSFQQYDYGVVENLLHYGTPEPPTYNVSQITAPVAAYYAKNDFLASIESQYLEKHGYPFESHHVLTDDGYIVTLHRIPAITNGFGENIDRVNPAVLFVPPMLCSSIDWVSRGANESLGLLLSDLVADFEEVCLQTLGLLIGFDSDEIALDYLLTLISDKPSGISFKQLFHYGQEMRADAFQQFDYGSKNNMAFYGSSKPPAYNVSAINVPVAVYYAKNDFFAALEDVEKLVGELPIVAESHLIEYDKFTHLDFIAAFDINRILYDKVIATIQNHNFL
ncbi:hypothetical protein D910_03673 [Dendroctonus ponderosae]|uniref:Partial AB-hydrolase lipase domain-containing protein n=1 Tax=Dendroctonus ponderosae TaxID=77166 RepID=U4TXD0_DENPD|nr:hypothetical protein D910_03673 [Dendroctonus ponderosae]